MDVIFSFIKKEDLSRLNIFYNGNLSKTKGIACKNKGLGIINLLASQWLFYYTVSTDFLISKISQTILHEFLHLCIDANVDYDRKSEERVCRALSGQDLEELKRG